VQPDVLQRCVLQVGDLGIALVMEATLAECKSVVGTPFFMAPEVCQSLPYSSQADIWSLGCVLYELCTLSHAFAADSLYSLIFRIVNGKDIRSDRCQSLQPTPDAAGVSAAGQGPSDPALLR
jgi:serine/threonine protein kinase